MGTTTTTVILSLFFALLASCIAQDGIVSQINTTRIYTEPVPGSVVSVYPRLGTVQCNADLFLLRNDPVNCLAKLTPVRADSDDDATSSYNVTELGCDSELVGATSIKCLPSNFQIVFPDSGLPAPSLCFVLNPATDSIVVLDADGNVLEVFDMSPYFSNPKLFDLMFEVDEANSVTQNVTAIVLDGSDVLWAVTQIYFLDPSQTNMLVDSVATTVTGTVVGLSLFSRQDGFFYDPAFLIAYEGDTTLNVNLLTGEFINPFGTFGNVKMMTMDVLQNIHVWDGSTNSVLVMANDGTFLRNATLPAGSVPIFMSSTRAKGLLLDNTGILQYEEDLVYSYSTIPVTCPTRPGSINMEFRGGDYPMLAFSRPGRSTDTGGALANAALLYEPGNLTIPIVGDTSIIQPTETEVLFDDTYSRAVYTAPSPLVVTGVWVNSSVFPAQSGNLSLSFMISNGFSFQLNCINQGMCLNGSSFEYLEYYINVGDGGQSFRLSIDIFATYYNPGDLPPNTWVKMTYHLPDLFHQGFTTTNSTNSELGQLSFTDTSLLPTQNLIYLDNMRLIPYNVAPTARKLYVYDFCGLKNIYYVPFTFEPMQIDITTKPVSCNINSTISTDLAYDGGLVAQVTNGVAPFTYNWLWSTDTNASELTGFPYMTTYISVYDNSLNASWVDVSSAFNYSLSSTAYFYSAPSSIAFTPVNEGDAVMFQIYPEVAMADYPIIEFWVNGGAIGGQYISVVTTRASVPTFFAIFNPDQATGQFLIPANRWTKIRYTLPLLASAVQKYSLVMFLNAFPGNLFLSYGPQPTLYLDDIKLISAHNVLTVTDNTGCQVSTPIARVTTPPLLTQSIHVTNAKCFNNSDGSVAVTMGGGTPPYHYMWSTNVDGATASGLPESIIQVNLSDANSCRFKPLNTTVLQPPPVVLEITIANPTCNGDTGTAFASADGGSGTYTFNWISDSGVARAFASPAPVAIFLDSPVSPFVVYNADPVCEGAGTHLIQQYPVYPSHSGYCTLSLFTTSSPTAQITGCSTCLSPARFNTILFWAYTDNATALQLTTIAFSNVSSALSSTVHLGDVATIVAGKWIKIQITYNQLTGIAVPTGLTFTRAAGSVQDKILIDDLVVIPSLALGSGYGVAPGYVSEVEVGAGTHYLTLVDSNGCSSTHDVVVTQPPAINITYNATSPTSSDGKDGSVSIEAEGGMPPYTYLWLRDNSSSDSAQNLAAGAYTVQVIDSVNCPKDFIVYVEPYIPPNIIRIRAYNANLSGGLGALVAIGFLICFFSAAMLYIYWGAFSVLGSFLSCMILVGCVLSFLAALVLLPEPTDALCTSFIWFLGVGFVLVYGCLFIKTWALYKVWRNAVRYKKAHLTPLYIIKCLCLAVGIEAIFLIIWTIVDPPKVHLMKSVDNTAEYQCNTNHITFWIIFLATKITWLIFGAVLSVLTRNIAKEYNESTSIAYAIYNNVLLGAIAIPLALLLAQVPGGRLTVEVVIICIAYCFTMVVIFFRIWHSIILPNKIPMNNGEMRTKRNTSSSGGSMRSGTTERESRDSRGSPNQSSISKAEVSASEAAV